MFTMLIFGARFAMHSLLRAASSNFPVMLPLALIFGILPAAQLYQVNAWDGISLLSATALGLLLAVAACLGSAWRLGRDDLISVLRHE